METVSYINCIYRAKAHVSNSPFDNHMTMIRMCKNSHTS